jgi:hypothetical protein
LIVSLYGLDVEQFERTRTAVLWAESQYGQKRVPIDQPRIDEPDGEIWIQTDSSAPGGYNGSGWFPGSLFRFKANGTTAILGPGLIKCPNGTALVASRKYRGIFHKMETWSGALRPAFWSVGDGNAVVNSSLSMGYYNAGAVTLSGGVWYTTITLYAGGTLTLTGAPWGRDAVATRQFLSYGVMANDHWPVILRDLATNTTAYNPIPFQLPADVRRFSSALYGQIVECRAASIPGLAPGPWVCKAWDFLGLVPVSGIYRAMLSLRPAVDSQVGPMGFAVVSVNTANPVSAGSGVSLSGQAFPSGMGGAFPGGSPNTNTNPEV